MKIKETFHAHIIIRDMNFNLSLSEKIIIRKEMRSDGMSKKIIVVLVTIII